MAVPADHRQYSPRMTPSYTSKFRTVALVEAVTYLVLLALTIMKSLDGPNLVPVMGPIHGIAFLVYLVLSLLVREEQGWSGWQTVLVIVAAALPFGAFVVNSRMVSDPAPAR
jgi:integral membrane protein